MKCISIFIQIIFIPMHLLFPPLSNFLLWDNMYMIMVNLITFMHSISNLYMIHSKLIHLYAYLYISSFLWISNAAVESEKLHACKSWNVDVSNWSSWELCIFGFVKREKIKLWMEILSFIYLNKHNVKIDNRKTFWNSIRTSLLVCIFLTWSVYFTCACMYIKASINLYYHYYVKWTCWILNHVIPILL